jgi:hypothetical protein
MLFNRVTDRVKLRVQKPDFFKKVGFLAALVSIDNICRSNLTIIQPRSTINNRSRYQFYYDLDFVPAIAAL